MQRPILWYGDQIFADVKVKFSKAAQKAAAAVYDDARAMCPVGKFERAPTKTSGSSRKGTWKSWKERRPGKLRDSIGIAKSKYYPTSWIVFVPGQGSDTYYSRWVELGAPKRSAQQWRTIGHEYPVPRQPFLRPALEKNKGTFPAELKRAFVSTRRMSVFGKFWSRRR